MHEADREQQRADQWLAGVDRDGDGKSGGQRQDGAGHVGTNQGIAGRHQQFGFPGVDHLGDEFSGCEIGHDVSFRGIE
jgi:hypothetical protein